MRYYKPVDKREINQLVKDLCDGKDGAFDLLYSKMKKVIFYFLLREHADKDAIEDVIASTFLVVVEKSKEKIIYKNCFSWILTIAKFQLMSYNQKHNKVSYDSESIDKCCTSININSLSFKHEVEKLDFQSQQILYFAFYEKMTYFDIAKILKISVSTVKRRRNEIINHFKEFYDEEN